MVDPLPLKNKDNYNQTLFSLTAFFGRNDLPLQKIKSLAGKIKACIDAISPVVQQATDTVCPHCKNVCCINKHGYYNFEDLVYLHALGVTPQPFEVATDDSAPCRFLAHNGCSMQRSMRPSGCNWYFCDALLDYLEQSPSYSGFDDALLDAATFWIEMMEEYTRISSLK